MKLRVTLGVALSGLVGCAEDPGIEDGEFDVFLTEEAKSDAFGVEDWSPDGMAVLKLTSTFSAAKLESETGVSERVAKAIVAQRKTLADGKFRDLRELDDAKFVGITVFRRLIRYATAEKLYKTAIRIPLVVEGTDRVSITSFNAKAREVGVTAFARYTFVDADTDYHEKALSYDKRLGELATKAGITIDGEMMRFASTVNEYSAGSIKPCYIGDGLEVPDVPAAQGDGLMGDMYSQWGFRFKTTKFIFDDQPEEDMNFTDDWASWDTKSTSVLIQSTNTDSGDEPEADIIPPCR